MGLGGSLPFMPEAQTLLTVVQTTVLGKPAPIAAWRAGACPRFALSTFPKNTSCTVAGSTPAFWSAATLQNVHTHTVLLLNPKTYYPHKRCKHCQDYSWGQTQKHVVLLSSKDFAIPKIQRPKNSESNQQSVLFFQQLSAREQWNWPKYVPWMAIDPNLVAVRLESDPLKLPIGVLATPTMHTSANPTLFKTLFCVLIS